VITPRDTRLVRVPDLATFRRTLLDLCLPGTIFDIRRRAVVVPSRAAGEQLRRSIEDEVLGATPKALAVPHLVTRDDWIALLQEGLAGAPPQASRLEREVLLQAAARTAVDAGARPPFTLRPGLVAEMLDFYDGVRRHMRSVDDFERVAVEELQRAVDSDRGAVRMLEQTRFLVAAFRGYEARLAEAAMSDEHGLRQALLAAPSARFAHVVLAVGDRAGDHVGLWPADFDLLTRLAGLSRLDVVATEAVLAAGFLERLRNWLPGLEEVTAPADPARATPRLIAPADEAAPAFWRYRDREEELAAIARLIKHACRLDPAVPLWRTAVVFKRPLPYVYLARQVFSSAGVPFQTFDALPLAAEPFSAALDLVFQAVESGFSRAALIDLLRSPLFTVEIDGRAPTPAAVALLDRRLSEARYLADPRELSRLAREWPEPDSLARAARAAVLVAARLEPLTRDEPPAVHLDTVLAFLAAYERLPKASHPAHGRHLRVRAATLAALARLRDAHVRFDDAPRPFADTVAVMHQWMEQQTFAPRHGSKGVQLVDADTARFGQFDALHIVGVTQREWPESPSRSIFYPASMLGNLGWPADADARATERAAFEDLLHAAVTHVSVSTITLEDDAIVEPSPFLEDLAGGDLAVAREPAIATPRIFDSEAMLQDPPRGDVLGRAAADWLALRMSRTPSTDARFHGQASPAPSPKYRVSAIDLYLACPFVYFATRVLRLAEEPDDEEALGPKAQGKLVHDVLQEFYEVWQDRGAGAVTADNLAEARALFATLVDKRLASLPDSDAALQRIRLLGSPVAPGFGDVVFEAEVEQGRGVPVVERLLEFSLDGETSLRTGSGARTLRLAAKADRIDLLADGTFRVIDYKLSRAPNLKHVVQLPAYAAAARQRLEGRLGRSWRASDAAYLAFGKGRHYEPLTADPGRLDAALADGEARLVGAVDQIERGTFPPAPAEAFRCTYCPFSGVCRKDYVGDE
jgi:RecB family exonuclease